MTDEDKNIIDLTEGLMNRVEEDVLTEFLSDEFGEENLENKYMGDLFNEIELDYLFNSLTRAFSEEISDPNGLVPSMVYWRMIRKMRGEFDRFDDAVQEIHDDMVEDEEEDTVGRTFQ